MFAFFLYPLKESQVLSISQALERDPLLLKTSATNANPDVQCDAKHALAQIMIGDYY